MGPSTRQLRWGLATLAAACLTWAGCGNAFASAWMVVGGATSQPIGHYEFCKKNPDVCSIRSRDTGPERTTDAVWKTVVALNVRLNHAIQPMSDLQLYGQDEVWAYPAKGAGDCEDYVLEKQRELEAAGFPVTDLLITVVRKRDGEGHAVLTWRTDRGDFVLDNLTDDVVAWDETSYRYLKRQDSTDTGRWVAIREGAAPLVGALH